MNYDELKFFQEFGEVQDKLDNRKYALMGMVVKEGASLNDLEFFVVQETSLRFAPCLRELHSMQLVFP